jgi:galacturan 1,4-alpha-galacturonidase
VYFKTWDGSVHDTPPTGGGGGNGTLRNVTLSSVVLSEVNHPTYISQTNGAESGDTASYFKLADITYNGWTGTSDEATR